MAAPRNTTGHEAMAAAQSLASANVKATGPVEAATARELRRLQSNMDDLESLVGSLFDQLQSVLSPDSEGSESEGQPDVLESPLVEELKRRRRQSARIIENVYELKRRIEL